MGTNKKLKKKIYNLHFLKKPDEEMLWSFYSVWLLGHLWCMTLHTALKIIPDADMCNQNSSYHISSLHVLSHMSAYPGPSSHNCQYRHHPQIKLLRLPRNTPLQTPTHKDTYETEFSEQVLQVTHSVYSQILNSGSISANASKGIGFSLLGEWKSPSWHWDVSTLFQKGSCAWKTESHKAT